jgi:hypothetical protein
MFGSWPESRTKNLILSRLIEILFYRKSQESYFIQIADFCAYALQRSEKHLASRNALGLHLGFDRLETPRGLWIIRDI